MVNYTECYMKSNCKGTCRENCPKLVKLEYLYDNALMSLSQRKRINLYLDNDNKDLEAFTKLSQIEKNIEEFVQNGTNLYIHSRMTGNGKTSWCLRLVQAYFSKIWYKCDFKCKALYINVPRFLLTLKDNISHESEYIQHIKENILEADLVVWDEVGVKSLTVFEHENLLNLINSRLDMNKSNLYTSNLSADELQEKLGDRLYSRVVNNSIDIEFFGQDKRSLREDI